MRTSSYGSATNESNAGLIELQSKEPIPTARVDLRQAELSAVEVQPGSAVHRSLHQHQDPAGFQNTRNLDQRFLLQLPVEERHQAAVAGDHVKGPILVREVDHRRFAEVDRELRVGLCEPRLRAVDHWTGVVDSVGVDPPLARVAAQRDAKPAADVQDHVAIPDRFEAQLDLEVSQLIVARCRRVIERLRDFVVPFLESLAVALCHSIFSLSRRL